ncbi:unnamed protein product [Coccothraustes coccothraustes]
MRKTARKNARMPDKGKDVYQEQNTVCEDTEIRRLLEALKPDESGHLAWTVAKRSVSMRKAASHGACAFAPATPIGNSGWRVSVPVNVMPLAHFPLLFHDTCTDNSDHDGCFSTVSPTDRGGCGSATGCGCAAHHHASSHTIPGWARPAASPCAPGLATGPSASQSAVSVSALELLANPPLPAARRLPSPSLHGDSNSDE